MTGVPVWVPLLSVIIGALASGGIQTALREVDRRREQESILNAITSEVAIICELVRFRGYLPFLAGIIQTMEAQPDKIIHPFVDINADYFSVFSSLSSSLGKVEAQQVRAIVRFYAIAKAITDSTRPNAGTRELHDRQVILGHHRELHELLRQALALGDEIVQFTGKTEGRNSTTWLSPI